jgi:hypothetical protein
MSNKGWIGVDLDGTLAMYDGWMGPDHIGQPIPAMLHRVIKWLSEGQDVRIMTARVSHDGTEHRIAECCRAREAIAKWCLQHVGRVLPITCMKDYSMVELWDDRAVQVIPNTGVRADQYGEDVQICWKQWLEKTDWVQEQIDTFPPHASLGMHRADVMRLEIERLRALVAQGNNNGN